MDSKNFPQLLQALSYFGERGIIGLKNNPQILNFFKKSKNGWVNDDETPWCAAFVNAVLHECALPTTDKLNARSFLDLGVETKTAVMGDLVVLWRISENSPFGHVGFFIREKDNMIYILGGNQNNQVNIQAFPKSRLLSYRSLIIN